MPTNSESLMWEARIKLPRENLEELLGNIVSNSSLIRAGGNPDIGIYELSILEMAVSILKVLEENHPTRKIYAYSDLSARYGEISDYVKRRVAYFLTQKTA